MTLCWQRTNIAEQNKGATFVWLSVRHSMSKRAGQAHRRSRALNAFDFEEACKPLIVWARCLGIPVPCRGNNSYGNGILKAVCVRSFYVLCIAWYFVSVASIGLHVLGGVQAEESTKSTVNWNHAIGFINFAFSAFGAHSGLLFCCLRWRGLTNILERLGEEGCFRNLHRFRRTCLIGLAVVFVVNL